MKNNNFIKHLLVIISISALLSGCGGAPKIFGEKPIEPNARKRAQQNVAEGRGIQLFKGDKRGSGNFLFASSRVVSNKAAAPSLIPEEFPGVTVPFFLKTVFNFFKSDKFKSALGCSS